MMHKRQHWNKKVPWHRWVVWQSQDLPTFPPSPLHTPVPHQSLSCICFCWEIASTKNKTQKRRSKAKHFIFYFILLFNFHLLTNKIFCWLSWWRSETGVISLFKHLAWGFLFKIHPEEVCGDWMVHSWKADVDPPYTFLEWGRLDKLLSALRIKYVTKMSKTVNC